MSLSYTTVASPTPLIVWFDQTLSLQNSAAFKAATEYPGPVLFMTICGERRQAPHTGLAYPRTEATEQQQTQVKALALALSQQGFNLEELTGPACDAVMQMVAYSGAETVLTDDVAEPARDQVKAVLQREHVELVVA